MNTEQNTYMQEPVPVLFQVWKVYQRRAESIAVKFNAAVNYYHYSWEERGKVYKAASYCLKSWNTMRDLFRYRPKLIIIQLPPTLALYMVAVYGLFTGTPYMADCHNAMILRSWIRWPFAKYLLRKAAAVIVHNENVRIHAQENGVDAIVIRDPLPAGQAGEDLGVLTRFGLEERQYVIVPWNLQPDEPIEEFIEAVRCLPEIKFAMTWYTERMPKSLLARIPGNLVLTGYLETPEFNSLFGHAGAAISLTTQQGIQPSAASEAIAYSVPIVLSDTQTARTLYKDAPVYVRNEAGSIAEGITEILGNRELYRENVVNYGEILKRDLDNELNTLKARIA